MSEDLKVFEFGSQLMVSNGIGIDIKDPLIKKLVEQEIEINVGALKYITDFKIIEEPEIIELPAVDILKRFTAIGWKAKYASNGYFELQKHFRCRKEHTPERITWKFIWRMVKELIEQRKVNDYE